MDQYVYKNITELSCPAGKFSVCCDKEKIPFSVRKNSYNISYYDVTTETNYALDINTSALDVQKQYDIVFSEGGIAFQRLRRAHRIAY